MNVRKGNLPQRKQFAIRRQSYCIVSKSYSSFHFRCEITKKFCTLAFCFGRCLSYLSVKISNLIGHVSEGVGAVIHHFFKFINSKKLLFQVAQRCILNCSCLCLREYELIHVVSKRYGPHHVWPRKFESVTPPPLPSPSPSLFLPCHIL